MSALILQFGANTDRAKNAMAQLATSVASNMGTVASVMGSTALTTVAATNAMGGGFGNAALAVARFAVQYRLLLGTLAIVGLGIAAANRELDELVAIGDKAKAVRLSPETFQAFTREAELSRIALKDAEAALTAFNQANKRTFDPSNEKNPSGTSSIGKFLQDLVLVQQQLANSPALERFLNTDDQNAKLRATIDLIRELQKAGQDLAATSLAEKAFGGAGEKIAEEIKRGKFELEALAEQGKAAGVVFSNELVNRAVELRDRLEAAWRQISDNLKPLLEGSVTVALALGNALATGVDAAAALAKAVNVVYQNLLSASQAAVSLVATLGQVNAAQGQNQASILQSRLRDPGLTPQQRAGLEAQLRQVQGAQQLRDNAIPDIPLPGPPTSAGGVTLTGRNVIVPTPGERPASTFPSGRSGGGSKADSYDERLETVKAYIEQLEKANRLAQAEVDTFGKGTVEREKALALSRLSVTATEAEKSRILELAESTGKYKQQLADLETQQKRNAEAARYFGDAATDALTDLIVEGKSAGEVLKNLGKSLASTLLRGALTGQGPLGVGGGGLFGVLGGLFGLSGKAGGGSVFGGSAYMVGESGPELFLPGQSGTIVPNGALRGGAGAAQQPASAPIALTINAPNSTPDSVRQLEARIPGLVMSTIADARRRGLA